MGPKGKGREAGKGEKGGEIKGRIEEIVTAGNANTTTPLSAKSCSFIFEIHDKTLSGGINKNGSIYGNKQSRKIISNHTNTYRYWLMRYGTELTHILLCRP